MNIQNIFTGLIKNQSGILKSNDNKEKRNSINQKQGSSLNDGAQTAHKSNLNAVLEKVEIKHSDLKVIENKIKEENKAALSSSFNMKMLEIYYEKIQPKLNNSDKNENAESRLSSIKADFKSADLDYATYNSRGKKVNIPEILTADIGGSGKTAADDISLSYYNK